MNKNLSLLLIACSLLIANQSHARSYSQVSSLEPKARIEQKIILIDTNGHGICGVGFSTENLRSCNVAETVLTAELEKNTYDKAPEVAMLPIAGAIGYYLTCTAVNAGTVYAFDSINGFSAESVSPFLGGMLGLAVSWSICLPATGINYGLVYVGMKTYEAIK